MNRRRCERIWQAEAREDGRLEKRDLASFERHAAHCAECSAEMAALPEPRRTDLEHRRARQELLRKANEEFLAAKPKEKPWKMWVFAGAVAASLVIFAWQRSERVAAHVPVFDVVDMTNAVWQAETIAATSRVKLQAGTAAFHVEHLESDARFYVELPDGQIEVRGTRFVVDVIEGKTRSVVVSEGTVWLDVPSFHGLLHAGERWPTEEKAAASPTAAEDAPKLARSLPDNPEPPAEDVNKSIVEPHPTPSIKTNASAAPMSTVGKNPGDTLAPNPKAETPKDEAGPRFAEAMGAFTAGDDARADQLLAAFVRDFPRDGRAEDATFLRAKARARHGDNAGAAAIAREYLQAFPKGLRRPEMERLAGETK